MEQNKLEVKIEPESTLIGRFQKERTDALSQMFDNKYSSGIYPTSQFFARLDECVRSLLLARDKEIVEMIEVMKREKVKGRDIETDDKNLVIKGYNKALNDIINKIENHG